MSCNGIAPVSVIIPCFRCKETIGRAVESVARQSAVPSEIILIDDNSNDGTLQKLQEIQASFREGWVRIIALSNNGGPGTARNVGWDQATQPYIAFLDSDDSWHPKKIEIQYHWMKSNPNVIFTGHQSVIVSDSVAPPPLPSENSWAFTLIEKKKLLISNIFSTPTVMLQRDIRYRFPCGKRYSEDYHLWLEMACNGIGCYYSQLPLAFLYKAPYGEGGLSANLWKMEVGELDMYIDLYKTGYFGFGYLSALLALSFIKFLKRILEALVFRRCRVK